MKYLIPALLCVPALALAQASDVASERSRIANQRIQAEADRQAQEEEQAQQAAARQAAAQQQAAARQAAAQQQAAAAAVSSQAAAAERSTTEAAATPRTSPPATQAPATRVPSDGATISRGLEHLRELGELRDAGYVTDEEFERIKRKILESEF